MSEVNQSVNKVQICGALEEINLVIADGEKELNGKKVKGKVIKKADFKNPSITLNVNGNSVGIDFLPVFYQRYDNKKKEIVENSYFKSLETLMTHPRGTRVMVDGQFAKNEYSSSKNDYEIVSFSQIKSFGSASSSRATDEDFAEGKLSGVIRKIVPEFRGDNETGRLKVEFVSFDNYGDLYSYDLIVPETIDDGEGGQIELASEFKDYYENGTSCCLDVAVVSVQHGDTAKPTNAFGRASKLKSGYTTTEFQVIGGDEPYAEESEYYVPITTVKEKMAERDVRWEQLKVKAKEKDSTSKTSAPAFVEIADDDVPF